MNTITSQNIMTVEEGFLLPNAATFTNTIIVDNGETLTNSTINSGEAVIVSAGGTTTYITLNGGVQYISSGGLDENATVYTGSQYVYSGGSALNTSIYSNAVQYVSGGCVSNVTVMSDATQYIYSGSGGDFNISGTQYIYGGSVSNITLNNVQYVSGGIVSNGTVMSGAVQYISLGSVASFNVSGTQYIYGGSVSNISVLGGSEYITGGVVNRISAFDGSVTIAGGDVLGLVISEGASVYISGGKVDGLQAAYGSHIISGGSVSDIDLGGGEEYVYGGTVSGGIIKGGTQQYVFGGTVTDINIQPGQFYNGQVSTSTSDDVVESWYPTTRQIIASGGVVNNFSMYAYTSFYHGMTPGGLAGMHGSYYDYYPSEQIVEQGGVISGGAIYGGNQYVEAGGIVNNVILNGSHGNLGDDSVSIVASALQYVSSGGLVNSTIIIDGVQYISSGAVASNTIISSADGIQIVDGATYDTTVIGGRVSVGSAGTASNITLSSGGSVGIQGEAQGNVYISSGGSLGLSSSAILDGYVTLYPGGHMGIGLSNGGSVDLIGNNNSGLVISGYTPGVNNSVTTAISGFSGLAVNLSDKVTVDGLQEANVSKVIYPDDNHITLELLDGTSLTLNMIGIKQAGYTLGSDASGNLTMVVCFLSGTMIKMSKGACAVEDLQIGDTVLTFNPKTNTKVKKKITWVGKQTARVNAKLPDDMAGYPVRILKDAFKKNVPNKDLLITSEHCLFIDGHFVPARMLVNGRSIFYDYSITSYDFYHIETEEHSVIWADGMLTESYLNTGNRHSFNKDQKVVKLDSHIKIWAEDAAAPLMVDRSFVEPIFNDLAKRADKQKLSNQNNTSVTLSNDHGLYLLTENGEEIYQNRVENDKVIFTLPANTQNIYLVSRKSRPCDVIGPFVDDRRSLGVLVGRVAVLNKYGAYPVVRYLQQDELQGWSIVEDSSYRWTMGCAFLPLDVYNAEYSFDIFIQIINAGPYIVQEEQLQEEKKAI